MSLDPRFSPDPAMRRIADYYETKVAELNELAKSIIAYGTYIKPVEPRMPVSPLEHYGMLDEEKCGCTTCVDWDQRRNELIEVIRLVPKGHVYTTCDCPDCRFVGRIQLNFRAADNRRDLLIEMAFHARYHSIHGSLIMEWLERELQSPVYTLNWCAQEMPRFPVERWIKRCEGALHAVVSGAVFRAAAGHAVDYIAEIRSTLSAETSTSVVMSSLVSSS